MIPSYTNPVVRKGRENSEGKLEVYIYYSHKNTRYFNTKVFIKPRHWSKKNRAVTENAGDQYKKWNKVIYDLKDELDQLVHDYKLEHLVKPTGDELRSLYSRKQINHRTLSFEKEGFMLHSSFANWIKWKKDHAKASDSSVKIYRDTYRYLVNYLMPQEKYITDEEGRKLKSWYERCSFQSLKDVDKRFLTDFRNWLSDQESRSTKKKLSNVTINKQIRNICTFLRDRSREGSEINANAFNVELDKSFSRRVYLNAEEIQKIVDLDLSKFELSKKRLSNLRLVKDVFTFNVYFGLRASDLLDLKKDHFIINDDPNMSSFLSLYEKKNRKKVHIPFSQPALIQLVKDLKNRYSGEALFPKLSLPSFNKLLKELGRLAGINEKIDYPIFSNGKMIPNQVEKWQKLSTHSIRKTSINQNIMRYDRDTAKLISNHASESGFTPYEDEADIEELARKIRRIDEIAD